MAEKMSIGEALGEITRFKNVFQAAERLEAVLMMVSNMEGEINRLLAEKKEAEEATKAAVEARDKAKALLEQVQGRLRSFQDAFDLEVSERRKLADEQIQAVKSELSQQLSGLKAKYALETTQFIDSLKGRVL